jgi:hypothetical protein
MGLLGTLLVGVAMTGCATMVGTNGNLENTGDAWFIRNVSFFGMVTDSSVWYCPSSDDPGPGICTEALIDQPRTAAARAPGYTRGRPTRREPAAEGVRSATPGEPTSPPAAAGGGDSVAEVATGSPPAAPLPERPTRDVAMARLALISEAVGACVERRPASVAVHVVFMSDGSVRDVGVLAPRGSIPVEQCLIRTVRTATVPAFSAPSFELTYQYRVQ